MSKTKHDRWHTILLLKITRNILFWNTQTILLLLMLLSGRVRLRGNDTFINSGGGIMGYTFEKRLRAKEEKLCIFSAWCFWDYEICLLKGPASLVQQSWQAAANTLWLLPSDPRQGCFKRLTPPTPTRFKIAGHLSPYPPGTTEQKNIFERNHFYCVRWILLMSIGFFLFYVTVSG